MSDAQATILAIAAGLALALVLGASLRRRRTVGYVIDPFDRSTRSTWTDREAAIYADGHEDGYRRCLRENGLVSEEEWTDEALDRLYAGIMADEEADEHEEWGFV